MPQVTCQYHAVFFNTILNSRICDQYLIWKIAIYQLSASAYSMYSQLPSLCWRRFFFVRNLGTQHAVLLGTHLTCFGIFYIYCSVHHNILLEITNRCNCMQWVLFLCLVHSTCFGRHTRPSSGVQSSIVSTATGTIIGWGRLSRLLVPEGALHPREQVAVTTYANLWLYQWL